MWKNLWKKLVSVKETVIRVELQSELINFAWKGRHRLELKDPTAYWLPSRGENPACGDLSIFSRPAVGDAEAEVPMTVGLVHPWSALPCPVQAWFLPTGLALQQLQRHGPSSHRAGLLPLHDASRPSLSCTELHSEKP